MTRRPPRGLSPIRDLVATPETVRVICTACGVPFDGPILTVLDDRPLTGSLCASCRATRAAAEADAVAAERCAAAAATHRARCATRLVELDVPPAFASATLDTFRPWGTVHQRGCVDRATHIARRLIGQIVGDPAPEPFLPFVVFQGAFGTGKTTLAYAIAKIVAGEHGRAARVLKLSAVVRDLRGAWGAKDGPSESQRLARYLAPDFLVIDEVSRHAFYGTNVHQHLYEIVNGRLEQQRVTVLTTNESTETLSEIIGGALTSRLHLGGTVDFGAQDYRTLLPEERIA